MLLGESSKNASAGVKAFYEPEPFWRGLVNGPGRNGLAPGLVFNAARRTSEITAMKAVLKTPIGRGEEIPPTPLL
jgi:hypothetical protein